MEIPTQQNHVYTLTCDNACEVYDVDTDRLIHEHHAGEVQSQFTAIGMKVSLTDDTAHITELFNGAPAGNGGGGYIESNLNVGHGAADAVAAVCTLTLGDLGTGGTLADSNGQSVELPAPHAYATGRVDIADATAAGTITFGTHEAIEFEPAPQTEDHAEAEPIEDYTERTKLTFAAYVGDVNVGGWYPSEQETPPTTLAELAALMNQNWSGECVLNATVSGDKIVLTALPQFHGQQVSIRREDYDDYVFPFEGDEIILSGGRDSRTPQEVVGTLNASEDCPAVAVLDHVEAQDAKAVFTPLENYESSMAYEFSILEDGEEVNSWVWGAQDGDTVQELLAALNDDHGQYWYNTRGIEATLEDGKVVLRRLGVHGDASNGYVVLPSTFTPFAESEETPIEGGRDAYDTITLTADEYGVNDTITITGSLFENPQGMSGGHGDYTIAELLEAISGEFTDITAAEGAAEGTITLTANTAGKAANTITYTATGCFGNGTVKQGSTVRGKNAVEQTAFKIYLNGEEFTGGSVTVDPTPTQGSPNAVSSGGVFTALQGKQDALTAGDGITLSGGTISVNANGAVNATDTKPVSGQTVNAAIAAAVIGAGGAALDGNNTFTQTNTFNGAVALNGTVTMAGHSKTQTELVEFLDALKLVMASAEFVDFSALLGNSYVAPGRNLVFDFPNCKSFTRGEFLPDSHDIYVRLGKWTGGNGPFGSNSNTINRNVTQIYPNATSITSGSAPLRATQRFEFQAPKATSISGFEGFRAQSQVQTLVGNLKSLADLSNLLSTVTRNLTSFDLKAKAATALDIHAARLDLESVQKLPANLKDWSGDANEHVCAVGINASIQESAATEIAAVKAELEGMGWTVNFTYNS